MNTYRQSNHQECFTDGVSQVLRSLRHYMRAQSQGHITPSIMWRQELSLCTLKEHWTNPVYFEAVCVANCPHDRAVWIITANISETFLVFPSISHFMYSSNRSAYKQESFLFLFLLLNVSQPFFLHVIFESVSATGKYYCNGSVQHWCTCQTKMKVCWSQSLLCFIQV